MRLGEVIAVQGRPVPGDLRQHVRAPVVGRGAGLQHQDRRALAEREAVALDVEGPAGGGGQRLQGVESREHQVADGVVAAGQHPGESA